MKAKVKKGMLPGKSSEPEMKDNLEEYPLYPATEDIYSKFREETELDPEDITKTKEPLRKGKVKPVKESDFFADESGDDLDVPGSELDDDQEFTGNEDEENNYYSLGGDNHNNLDEDKDDL